MKKNFSVLSVRKILSVAVALVMMLSTFQVVNFIAKASDNASILVNPDFEDGLDGYEYATVSGFTVETVTDTVKSGSKALHLKMTGSAVGQPMFWQNVGVESNSIYEWKFWAKSNSGATQNTMVGVRTADGTKLVPSTITSSNRSDALDGSLLTFDSTRSVSPWSNWHQGIKSRSGSKEWVEYTVTFETMGETDVLLTLNPYATGREFWLDNMSLSKQGEGSGDSGDSAGGTEFANGGFEDGLSGYKYANVSGFTVETVTGTVKSGSKALHLNVTGGAISSQLFWRSVQVESNTTYEWKFWAKSGTNANTLFGVRTADGATLLSSTVTTVSGVLATERAVQESRRPANTPNNWHQGIRNTGDWAEYTVTFTTSDETTVLLTYNLYATGRELWVDDMSLSKQGEGSGDSAGGTEFANGGFEDGLSGYKYADLSGFTVETVTGTVKSGSKALHLNVTGGAISSQLFWRSVQVESNTTYEWKFWAKSGTNANTLFGVRTADGTTLLPSTVTTVGGVLATDRAVQESRRPANTPNNWHQGIRNTGDWAEYTVTFTTSDETTVLLTYNLYATGRELWVDDMSLTSNKVVGEIVNGDFEYGLSGYSYDNTVTSIATGKGNVYSGESAVKVAATKSGQSISKTVYTEKDKKYVWKFWAKLTKDKEYQVSVTETTQNPSAVEAEVKTTVNNGKIRNDGGKNYIIGTGDWNEYTVTFLSGENESLRLSLSSTGAATILTDNWSFTAYVEPGVLLNPSFEEDINAYKVNEVPGFTAETVTDTVKDGEKALHLKMTGASINSAMIWQQVAVETNTVYEWKFYAKTSNDKNTLIGVRTTDGQQLLKSSISCNVSDRLVSQHLAFNSDRPAATWGNWHQGIKSSSEKHEWAEYTVTFETGDTTSVLLTVNVFAAGREIWLDDMSLEAIQKVESIPNSGFENGTEGYYADGLTISADSENKYYGDYSLKMLGSGTLKKPVEVDAYTDYEWTFYFKTATAGEGYFGVCGDGGITLLASDISVSFGAGTVDNVSFADDRIIGFKTNYHKVISDGTWSKYTVKFNSGKQNQVILTYLGDGIEAYTDEWALSGSFVYAEEQLLNAGFEDGRLNAYNNGSSITAEITTKDPKSGKYAAKLTKDSIMAGNAHFYQTVKVKPNSDYIWTFWVKFEEPATPVGAEVVNNSGAYLISRMGCDHNAVIESSSNWHRIRYNDKEWHKYQILMSTGSSDLINLRLYLYSASSQIVTDDWAIEYVGETKKSNTIFEVGFEGENAIRTSDSDSWMVTDKEAHSGSKSVYFDCAKAMTKSEIPYNDEYGIERRIAALEKNTNYRFSFYFKGEGNLERAFLRLDIQDGTKSVMNETIGCDSEEWNYFEIVFNTKDSATAILKLSSAFVGYKGIYLYVDDIKLEKVVPGITDHTTEPDSIECSDEDNLIPNNLTEEITLDNTADDVYELKLEPYGIYNFAFDYYGESDPNAQIGLSFAKDGAEFIADKLYSTTASSIITVNQNSSEFKRNGYSFCAPENGIVYLVIKNTSGTVKLDNLTLYSILPESVGFKDLPVNSNGNNNTHSSIWDQDYDFDFDWNNEDDYSDDNIYDDTIYDDTIYDDTIYDDLDNDTIIDSENNTEENKSSGKKMLQVRKRALISKGKPGINVWLIVAISAAAVIAAGGAVFAIFFIRKRKKNKT